MAETTGHYNYSPFTYDELQGYVGPTVEVSRGVVGVEPTVVDPATMLPPAEVAPVTPEFPQRLVLATRQGGSPYAARRTEVLKILGDVL